MDQQPFFAQQQPQQVVYVQVPAPVEAPVLAVDHIKEAEEKVAKSSKRVAITSKVLIALGIVGLFCSIIHGTHARGMAQRIVSGNKPWGPPPTREEEMAMGA